MVRCKSLLGEGREVVCKGHVGDVNVVKFVSVCARRTPPPSRAELTLRRGQFPSSEVILTGSSDMSIRIFSALVRPIPSLYLPPSSRSLLSRRKQDGANPRTLVGHTKPLTSLHIVGKGRRILSSSMDGTVRLWDVAKGELLQRWNFPLPVTGSLLLPPAEAEEEEDATEWHLVVSYTNGTASLSSLSLSSSDPTPRLLLSPASSSPVESLAYTHLPRPIVALGSREGVVSVFLLPPVGSAQEEVEVEPAVRFCRLGSSVRGLQFVSPSPSASASASPTPTPAEVQLVVATSDGLPFSVTLQLEREGGGGQAKVPVVAVKEEFAGLDCEAATGVACTVGGGAVWVSGADGNVRKYVRS